MKPLLLAAILIPAMSEAAQNYSAERLTVDGVEIVRLRDAARNTEVSIAPAIGNIAFDMKVNGKSILWSPVRNLAEWKAKPAQMLGNPLLSPWANRLDQDAFFANGKKYTLNRELNNYRHDAFNQPIHGLVTFTDHWKVVDLASDADSAWITSRLEAWRYPDWMAQFPFAHTLELTYRLHAGTLEVRTTVENLSAETMPLSLAHHTYYQIPGVPRDDWSVRIPAKEHVTLSKTLVPTGDRTSFPASQPLALRGTQLDDVYTSLERNGEGMAEFSLAGGSSKITVLFGPKYYVGVVYAPPGREFMCFEPMAGITNAFNLAHDGKYNQLQTIPPGAKWTESFWITPSGF